MEATAVGDLVNLRQVRKSKGRARKQQQAAENRIKYGRSKSDRRKDEIEEARQDKAMDGKRLDNDQT